MLFGSHPADKVDAGKHIRKEGGIGALTGAASDFFIIKQTADRNILNSVRLSQGGNCCKRTGQIVQPRRGDQFIFRAPTSAGHAVIDI